MVLWRLTMHEAFHKAETSKERQLLSKQIVGLDGLRLAAASVVLLFHLFFAIWLPGANRRVPLTDFLVPLQRYFSFGWVGVEIFFVISGFVIAYSAHGISAMTFLRHRWLRLFPCAVLCATVSGAALLYLAEIPRRSVAFAWGRSVLFFPGGTYVDGAYWTLSIEISFYAIVFLLLLLRREHWMPGVMAMLGSVSTAYWVLHGLDGRFQAAPPFLHMLSAMFRRLASYNISLIAHGCYFALGVFLWLLLLRQVTGFRLCMAALCFFGGILQITQRTVVMQKALHVHQDLFPPVVLWILAVAVIILSVRWNHGLQQTLGMRGIAILRSLGLMTYPLYLLNQTLGRAMVLALYRTLGYAGSLFAATGVVIGLTFLIAIYLEPPLRKRIAGGLEKIMPTRKRDALNAGTR